MLRTQCDTEVLPHLYEEYGADCVRHIDGMFAVALFDTRRRRGLLARDRFGKKPLYYHHACDGTLWFASEIKALLHIAAIPRRICHEALYHFLSYKHVPCPLTIYEGIRQLPPAHTLVWAAGAEPRVAPYWELDFGADTGAGLGDEEIIERLETHLRQSVRRRLMSDVPLACFLSGGIDSSLTTALAAEASSTRLRTFCLTYAEDSTSEGKISTGAGRVSSPRSMAPSTTRSRSRTRSFPTACAARSPVSMSRSPGSSPPTFWPRPSASTSRWPYLATAPMSCSAAISLIASPCRWRASTSTVARATCR